MPDKDIEDVVTYFEKGFDMLSEKVTDYKDKMNLLFSIRNKLNNYIKYTSNDYTYCENCDVYVPNKNLITLEDQKVIYFSEKVISDKDNDNDIVADVTHLETHICCPRCKRTLKISSNIIQDIHNERPKYRK